MLKIFSSVGVFTKPPIFFIFAGDAPIRKYYLLLFRKYMYSEKQGGSQFPLAFHYGYVIVTVRKVHTEGSSVQGR